MAHDDTAQAAAPAHDAMAREAALREILSIISTSRSDPKPVVEAILTKAKDLCGAGSAGLVLYNEASQKLHFVHMVGRPIVSMLPDQTRWDIDSPQAIARAVKTRNVVHEEDFANSALYASGDPTRRALVDDAGVRSVVAVPLLQGDKAVGVIAAHRHDNDPPFEQRDIDLLQAFAAQAVIAIENARQFNEVQERLDRERASAEILELISQSRDDTAPVFAAILERGARLCGSDYAGLALISEDGTDLVYTAHYGPDLRHSEHGKMRWALDGPSTFADAIKAKRPVMVDDLEDTDLYRAGHPQRVAHVDEDGLHSFMAVPLILNGVAIGAFGIARFTTHPFNDNDSALIEGFAAQAVIAIENVRQFRALEALNAELGQRVDAQVDELERMGKLKRFLPEQVADAVISSGDDSLLSSHRALIAALFCDIRGFTAFCETAEPEETIEVLQAYHEEMGHLISAHGAGVDHRAGDGIMVLFNDPLPCDDPAGDALRLAFAMRDRMERLSQTWRKLGHRLGFGVGISLGYATVGMVGSEGRFHYTASGTAVNLAARLCDMAADGEILLSPRAWIAVEDDTQGELVGAVELKGISAPVEIWRAVAPKD